jgi:O-antigen/teichoic acid export membrane protein
MLLSTRIGRLVGSKGSIRRDYFTTFVTAAAEVVSYLATFRLVALRLGEQGFGEYALSRRTLSFLMPLSALGLDLAITRYVAFHGADASPRNRAYLTTGLLVVGVDAVVLTVVLLGFKSFWAELFFGSGRYSSLVLAFPLLLTGVGLHGVVYGYLRGRMRIQRANLLTLCNQVAIPLLAVAWGGADVSSVLMIMGAGWSLTSLTVVAFMPLSTRGLRESLFELARYGIPRVPGVLLQMGLFALPGILIAHLADITSAGTVAFGIAALGMVGSALAPVGIVLLPRAANLLGRGDVTELRRHLLRISWLTIPPLVVGVAAIEILAPTLVTALLGPGLADKAGMLRLITAGAIPWGIFILFRTVIEARHLAALNTRNLLVTCLVFVGIGAGLLWWLHSALAIVLAFLISLCVLGILTIVELNRILRINQPVALQ